MILKRILYSVILLAFIGLTGCMQVQLYEKNSNLSAAGWTTTKPATGIMNIADTNAIYKLYVVLRHTDAYKYENVWLNIGLQSPTDSVMQFTRYNVSLTNNNKGWEGVGMNDIWEIRKLVATSPTLLKQKGDWKFSIAHLMRDEPLKGMLSAGLRIEKQ